MRSLRQFQRGPIIAAVGILTLFLTTLFYVCYTSPMHFRSVAFIIQTSTGYRINDVPFYLYLADDVPLAVDPVPQHVAKAIRETEAVLSSVVVSVPDEPSTQSHRGPTVYTRGDRHYMQLSEEVAKAALGAHAVRQLQRSQVDLRQFLLDVTSLENPSNSWMNYITTSWFIAPNEREELNSIQASIIQSKSHEWTGTESISFLVVHPMTIQATVRYSAKSHMVCPTQVLFEYPLAFVLVVHFGLANYPSVITPTLVSFTHLLCAILAGFCFVRSVKKGPRRSAHDAAEGDALTSVSPMSPTGMTDWEGRTPSMSEPEPHRYTVQRRWVVIGCGLFWLRNVLDLVDGLLARQHRLQAGTSSRSIKGGGTEFGFNGHTIDVVTDTIGCTLACLGMFYAMCMLKYTLPAWWMTAFHRLPLPQIVFQKVIQLGRLRTSQIVVFFGLGIPATAAGIWEIYMLRYSNLLDPVAMYDPGLFEIEHSLTVRMCWFVWSLCSGDAWVICFILCALFGGYRLLWNFSIFAASVGYIWVFFFGIVSEWIWWFVVLRDLSELSV